MEKEDAPIALSSGGRNCDLLSSRIPRFYIRSFGKSIFFHKDGTCELPFFFAWKGWASQPNYLRWGVRTLEGGGVQEVQSLQGARSAGDWYAVCRKRRE